MPSGLGPDANLRVRRLLFLLFVLLVTGLFFGMIRHMLMASFWAVVLAVIFHEPYEKLLRRMGNRRNLSAAITMLFVIVVVVIPIGLISKAIIDESVLIYEEVQEGDLHPGQVITSLQERIPLINDINERLGFDHDEQVERLINLGSSIANGLGKLALRYTQNIVKLIIDITLMLYLLFFFIRDGRKLIDTIVRTIPLGDTIEERLIKRFTEVSRATVKGTLVVALIQGGLGGIMFAILGIPGATLWGVLMMFLALLPVGGTALVWGPAVIILFAQGLVGKAVALLIFGALVIGLADNILRPLLVSRDTNMPDYLILLATIGGLASFGLAGFVLGPVIAALFLTCWEITGQLFGGAAK